MQEPSEFRGQPEAARQPEPEAPIPGAAPAAGNPEKPAEIVVRATSVEIRPESAAPDAPPEPTPAPQPARPEVVPPSAGKPEEFANRAGAPSGSGAGLPPSGPGGIGASEAPRAGSGWAVACHLVGLIDFGVSVLFLGLLATLAVWLVAKDKDPEANFHGKEALNFQLNVLFWQVMAVPLCCCLIGGPLALALPILKLVLMIVAAAKAANGERWRYPLVVRVLG